jgi:hypothetical protein
MGRTRSHRPSAAKGERRECCDTTGGDPHAEGCAERARTSRWTGKGGQARNLRNWEYVRAPDGKVLRDPETGKAIMRKRTRAEGKALEALLDEAARDGRRFENQLARMMGTGSHRWTGRS